MLSGRVENLMEGFGVHTSMWSMSWDRAGAELAIAKAASYNVDFVEIALLNAAGVDAKAETLPIVSGLIGFIASDFNLFAFDLTLFGNFT